MQTVVTHDGSFHPDDVLAIATIKLLLGDEQIDVIRTRDTEQIEKADWVIDVGDEYDPKRLRFDHHQNGILARENGVPYAALGLVWKEYGEQICGSANIADKIEKQLVQPIDACDNNISLYELTELQVAPYELFNVIKAFHPVWGNEHETDTAFMEAVEFGRQLLARIIAHERAYEEVEAEVEEAYQQTDDKELMVFDAPVDRHMFIKYPDVKIVVYPRETSKHEWIATPIPSEGSDFDIRTKLPEEWSGLVDGELAEVSGIPDAVFCHKKQYFFVAESKESALKAARVTLGRE